MTFVGGFGIGGGGDIVMGDPENGRGGGGEKAI